MLLPITSTITALLILMQVVLTFRVIGVRRSEKVLVGDGNSDRLIVRMRSHANFIEVTPITLIALGLCEYQALFTSILLPLGITLFIGRVFHALGMELKDRLILRQIGMVISLTAMLLLSGFLLSSQLFQ